MFNLVLIIVSLALSVALTLAGVMLLSPASSRGSVASEVETRYNEAMRISEALQMWRWSHFGSSPSDVSELVSARYLSTTPSAGWQIQGGVLKVSLPDEALCKALNRRLGQLHESVPACSAVLEADRGVCCN